MKLEQHASTKLFTAIHSTMEDTVLDGQPVVRAVKRDKLDQPDENTYLCLNGITLHNGTFAVRLRSRLLPDVLGFARGFLGIVFRAAEDTSEFESFYVRPTNGRDCTDPVRRSHGCQYFAYPGYTFSYFREFGVPGVEAPVEIALDEWFTLRAVIRDETASFYLNDAEEPVLTIPHLKHGIGQHGSLGIYLGEGTEAFLSDIWVETED